MDWLVKDLYTCPNVRTAITDVYIHASGTDLLGCLRHQVFDSEKVVSIGKLNARRGIRKSAEGQNQFHCIFGSGDICYIVHPSDTASALVALEAKVQVACPKVGRILAIDNFFVLPVFFVPKKVIRSSLALRNVDGENT